ncbi:MAG: sigma-E processing peptidase SpoIIGA [Clostridium sp.]|nr:sigma-E processing peptidase SpoIIGA [Clostridium sp.]MCM1444724.1 sigma-E processing peptidase SpoIIGA [Candidatus Amulumruptor caecigallinarius]
MKIYIDLVLFINFFLDFLLLLSVSIVLKRNTKIYKVMIASFIGSLSILFLFIKINSIELFLLKILISVLMILISFGFKNIKYFLKNFLFLYINSIILGGFIYFLNIQFSYKNNGLVFYHNGLSINIIFLLITSPIIIYLYVKQIKSLKNNYSNYYNLTLYLKNKKIKCTGFLDTGNHLKSPYSNKPVVIINEKILKDCNLPPPILIPINTVSGKSLLNSIKIKKVIIDGIGTLNNVIFALSKNNININGVDCIINLEIMEMAK